MKTISENLITGSKHIYMIGIGGVGMSALARVLAFRGFKVSGSDAKSSARIEQLGEEGISVSISPKSISYDEVDMVIYSSAIESSHLELAAARASGIPVYHRAEILATVLNQAQTAVAITGTHGKTTTSSMVAYVLNAIGKNPTCLIGGEVLNFKTNTLLGNPNLCVSEVDESDQTHEFYAPHYAIVTNLEQDHVDRYKSHESLDDSFKQFFSNLENPGVIIYNADDKRLSDIVKESGKPAIRFGLEEGVDYRAEAILQTPSGLEFDLIEAGFYACHLRLSVPGIHNVYNALGTVALLIQLGVDLSEIQEVIEGFRGTKRRLEVLLEEDQFRVIDDYAHHPTEVRAAIQALQVYSEELTVIFQPHRFSRTQFFAAEFAKSFEGADRVLLTDIYSAGEANPEGISIECLFEALKKVHSNVEMVPKENLMGYFDHLHLTSGTVAFLGAGDIGEYAHEYANRFKSSARRG